IISAAPRSRLANGSERASMLERSGGPQIKIAIVNADRGGHSARERRTIVRRACGSSMLQSRVPFIFKIPNFLRADTFPVGVLKVGHIRDHIEQATVGVARRARVVKQGTTGRVDYSDGNYDTLYVAESVEICTNSLCVIPR